MEKAIKLSTIKGNANNGDKARICIQRHDMAPYGFAIGSPITITCDTDKGEIRIIASPDGKNRVSRVTDKRRGIDYQTIDIRIPQSERTALFNNTERLAVYATTGKLLIKAA